VLDATVASHDPGFGLTILATGAGALSTPRLNLPVGACLRIHVHARDVIVATERPAGISALNVIEGRISRIEEADATSAIVEIAAATETLVARVTRRSAEELALAPGRTVYAIIKKVALDSGAPGRAPEIAEL
jgi:molybdate transport system ATP-binding protein